MKSRRSAVCLGTVVLLCLCFCFSVRAESNKPIRLRNPISTDSAALAQSTASNGDSSLFVIQFREPLKPEWREQLKSLGVDLLRYVPDDAFVAKIGNDRISEVQRLSFVQTFGRYGSQQKLHRRLQQASLTSSTNLLDVAVLLSPRAIDTDVEQTKRSFVQVQQEANLHSGRVLRGNVTRAQLNSLAASDQVLWIEPAPKIRLNDEVASRIVAGDGPVHQTQMQSLGYNGTGVTVAVADSGLDSGDTNSMHPDIQGRVRALFYYGAPGQLDSAADEHSHGTHVAGIVAGNGATGETDENNFLYGLGVAPGASLIAQRIFDGAGGYAPPPSFEKLTRDAKRAGADIGSNSWGDDTQGQYDISAMEFDELVRDADALTLGDQQYILEFSAGNAGPGYQTIGSPAVAKNVIATGASQNDRFNLPIQEFAIYADGRDAMADFSSRGPCADGRIKPDLVAPGSWIASLRSIYANDANAWWPISDNYLYQGGTSQAGPHVSGAAAVFVQYWRSTHSGATPSPALVKAALINSATDMDDFSGTDPVPNMDEGWGRVNLPALIGSSRNYDFTDQSVLLTNGAVFEKRVLIGSANEPLKITLAYTDVPGLPASVVALVNDLDLEVISPDGHIYRGNRFEEGESIPDATGADTINNVEAVHLFTPVPGEYLIRIRASRVVEDARSDTPQTDQDFALVVSGTFAAAGTGIVAFDRAVYSAPALMKLSLVDYDLAGQSAANILLRSGAEPTGEMIALHANGNSGVFTGAVATATGPAIADGKLQVAHGNTIEAIYADASPTSNRVFTARADLQPPVISNVQATNKFGQISVAWNTDEAASGEIYYGVSAPTLALTNHFPDVAQEFFLANIPANVSVKFFIVAQDEAGNRSTNNNGGIFFTITNKQPPQILLVDSFRSYLGFINPPPLSGYTNALNQLDAAYDFFDATSGDIPSQAQLNSYRCVIWRVSDLEAPSTVLAQRVANYVNSGGSLLLASMEVLTRFAEAGLSSFNTGTLRVQSYTEDQPVDDIAGSPSEPIGNGINTTLDYSPYSDILAIAGTTDPSDWIVPNTNAASVILSGGAIVGLRAPKTGVDLPGRVVFLSFPLDAVPLGSGIGNNRAGLLQNILNFLAPPVNTSTLTLDSDVYSVPGRAVVEVEDTDIQGQGTIAISVHSPQHTNQLSLSLFETARPGQFRGSVVFVQTNSSAPGTFLVNANDTVQFDYHDTSSGSTVSASATIETNPPIISGVFVEPGYLEAVVSWETSELADSLVQYSESPDSFPINFTSYDPSPTMGHQLLLNGLKPNTKYYLRVSSRDRAGNTSTDDNGGKLYTFTTLLPRSLPWFDNMETNSAEWSTFASTDSDTEWSRGVPGGGESAFSMTNCWGSNLGGGPVSQMETYLVSPGVLLTGGNRATLSFWQNYDFTSTGDFDFQLAALEIITNATTEPQLLVQMPDDFSAGWEHFQFDLTPYMGKVVYIVWYHFLLSFDATPRLGWLVDDVSITITNILGGTINVTNNLWQANAFLSGPTAMNVKGRYAQITNAPPGEYVLEFADLPFYATPPPQTNTLVSGGIISFTGSYTFTDVNSNGIPDAYEAQQFGSVNPQRTKNADTDGDGMSDWAEFVAGTDPNNPPPPFQITARRLGSGAVELSWPSVTNHSYRVDTSLNFKNWSAYSSWFVSAGTNTTFIVTITNSAAAFFRVEALPAANSPVAATFRVTASLLPSKQVRLDWASAPGHGYRILSSVNGANWSPFTDWIRASGCATSFTFAPGTNSTPSLFRVEAEP